MQSKFYGLLLVIFVIYNIGLGSWGLTESSEARYAEISREMVLSGDYLHPTLLGIQHYHKPPVAYYITTLGYQIFGINEYGARFFMGIALIFQLFLVFKIAQLIYRDDKKAFASAIIYFSFPIVLIATRNLTTDAYLMTFVIWSIYLWLQYKNTAKVAFLYGFYTVLGIAFLTKGPVALIPGLIFIGSWKFFNKEKFRISIHTIIGSLLFILVGASWFVAIIIDNPQILNYFIDEQIINRVAAAEKFHRSEPIWYYLITAPVIGLPWLFFIVYDFIKRRKIIWGEKSVMRILAVTVLVILILFSLFSSKLILYIMPAYPFLALLGGGLIFAHSQKTTSVYTKIYLGLFILLIAGLLVANFINNITIDLRFAIPLIILIIAALFFSYRWSRNKLNLRLLYLSFSFASALLLTHTLFSNNNAYTINSIDEVVDFVKAEKAGNINKLVVYDYLLPSAAFYLDTDAVVTLQNDNFYTKRDIRFEKNTDYKDNLINIATKNGIEKANNLILEPDIVLIKRKKTAIKDEFIPAFEKFKHQKEMGKWMIYY
ncbi:MAG: glycosyltransferase family 39 protein [Leeuwenhoekiella sp.]